MGKLLKKSKIIFILLTIAVISAVAFCCSNEGIQTDQGLIMSAKAASSANPNAMPEVSQVLDYLYSLPSKTNKKVISGQFFPNLDEYNTHVVGLYDQIGYWPGLIGGDYYHTCWTCDPKYSWINPLLIDYWNNGGLITLTMHMPNPCNGEYAWNNICDIGNLLDPAESSHITYMNHLDKIAEGLQELENAGVVVLYRPFHEMNGNWFWWGGKDKNDFVSLWVHMFNYFAYTKGLDNILWVYGPNRGSTTLTYYPGDQYVDIVGLDAYTDYISGSDGYDDLISTGKPFGFTEFGPYGPSNPPGDYDYTRLINGIRDDFPETTFFQAWSNGWSMKSNLNAQALFEDPWIINRDDIYFKSADCLLPDLDYNNSVDSNDLAQLKSAWGTDQADFNQDLKTDTKDLGIMMSVWGSY